MNAAETPLPPPLVRRRDSQRTAGGAAAGGAAGWLRACMGLFHAFGMLPVTRRARCAPPAGPLARTAVAAPREGAPLSASAMACERFRSGRRCGADPDSEGERGKEGTAVLGRTWLRSNLPDAVKAGRACTH
eukprot:361911-Chlamydomonas_euryale.AAC.1